MDVQSFYSEFLQCGKVVIDSRKVEPNDIFFAFSGDNFNGATKAQDAINTGARAVIMEDEAYADATKHIFYVPSTLNFLQDLARYHRGKLSIPFVGLTGSNGKTTTKELMHAVLSKKYRVQSTVGNLNNHIGVPLTVLSVRDHHEVAVVEMGANHQKEIEFLCTIARPDIGYITNFGKAHLEGFGGFEGVVSGKSELYAYLKHHNKTILVFNDDALQTEKTIGYHKVVSFGKSGAQYNFEPITNGHFIGIRYGQSSAHTQLTGAYNFSNICAAATLGMHLGVDFNSIKSALEAYVPTNMRSQVLERNGKTLVLDTYNANPSSMAASLQNFKNFEGPKTVILGDMLELGAESLQEHKAILQMAKSFGFEEIITVGAHFMEAAGALGKCFPTTGDLKAYIAMHAPLGQTILLKGSRGVGLEKILDDI